MMIVMIVLITGQILRSPGFRRKDSLLPSDKRDKTDYEKFQKYQNKGNFQSGFRPPKKF